MMTACAAAYRSTCGVSGLLYAVVVIDLSYYGFGLSLDTRDLNAYVSRAKRTRCYAVTATFPRANCNNNN